jgi:hypothetical protein
VSGDCKPGFSEECNESFPVFVGDLCDFECTEEITIFLGVVVLLADRLLRDD